MIKRLLFALPLLFTSCLEFRTSDEKAKEQLSETNTSIAFGNLLVGDKNMHYAYSETDNEDLVVFVHGSPGSWNAFIDFFKADSLLEEVDMLSVDRPGFGESDFGQAEGSLEKQAELIAAVVNEFHHIRVVLVGHSLGAPVIARMVMDNPYRYHGLVLVAPSIDPEMEKEEWYRSVIDTKLGEVVTPVAFKVSNEEILQLKEELNLMVPLWEKIQIPTMLIQGTKDRLVPKENADFAERMLPDSILKVRRLEDVDHFIPWSHPNEITNAIQKILDGVEKN